MKSFTALTLVAGALALFPARAESWSADGHRIVCSIAFALLSPDEQTAIERLTPEYRTPDGWRYYSFPSACVFADIARARATDNVLGWSYFNRFNQWHYFNVTRSTRELDEDQCDDDCVLTGIDRHLAELSDHGLEDWRRAQALFLLAHWVGDVHQPLHVSYQNDRGGNDVDEAGPYYAEENLHAVWDRGIIDRARQDAGWFAYAEALVERIPDGAEQEWLADGPIAWAQESYDITTTDEVDYCRWVQGSCRRESHDRRLDGFYQARFERIVEERLQQAGVRLAGLIRQALE